MIKVREEEEAKALAAGAIRKKTYKGDVEIEADDAQSKIEVGPAVTHYEKQKVETVVQATYCRSGIFCIYFLSRKKYPCV